MRIFHLAILLLILTSCNTFSPDKGCLIFTAVYVSPQDQFTDGTARQILGNNEVGAKECGWKPTKVDWDAVKSSMNNADKSDKLSLVY